MNKKYISIVLVLLIAFAVLCGCSKSSDADTSVSSAATSTDNSLQEYLSSAEDTTAVPESDSAQEADPAEKEDNETEILTVPSQGYVETQPEENVTEPENDNQSETRIELPFIPVT